MVRLLCASYCAEHCACNRSHLFKTTQYGRNSYDPLSQIWKVKVRDIGELAQSHTAHQRWSSIQSQTGQLQKWPFDHSSGHCSVLPYTNIFIITVHMPPFFFII